MRFCNPDVLRYEDRVTEKTDAELERNLYHHYPKLDSEQRSKPQFRKWRRLVITELLRRGLLDKDPGPNAVPERR